MATLEGVNRTTSQYGDLRGAVLDRTPSQFCCLERAADHSITAPRRSNSAHVWTAVARHFAQGTLPCPSRGGARVTNGSGVMRLAE
jgi:hypothetical protein